MKTRINSVLEIGLLVALFAVLGMRPAHAYVDPGSGSYAMQIGLASALTALFSVKMFWQRLRQHLHGPASTASEVEEGSRGDARR